MKTDFFEKYFKSLSINYKAAGRPVSA